MMWMRSANAWAVACGLALTATACDRSVMKDSARGHEGAPINLVGCVQKSESGINSYVLTQVNSPTQSVGTSGSGEAKPGAVAREQMREARHTYRLDGDNSELDKLVGKQVSVEGTIEKSSDLAKRAEEARKDNTAPDLGAGDLAKVEVKSIAAVSDSCGDQR